RLSVAGCTVKLVEGELRTRSAGQEHGRSGGTFVDHTRCREENARRFWTGFGGAQESRALEKFSPCCIEREVQHRHQAITPFVQIAQHHRQTRRKRSEMARRIRDLYRALGSS